MTDHRLAGLGTRMDGALEVLLKEFTGLRTGRASVNLLDSIKVDVYGSWMPLTQIGTINTPEPRMLTVQVWDKGMVKNVEKAIRDSDLGLNPTSDGQLIRIPLPPMSEQRRLELVKIAGKYAEESRISVRNIRRDGMEMVKKWEKDGEISEDERHKLTESIQTLTDNHIKKIDDLLAVKQKDIMQV